MGFRSYRVRRTALGFAEQHRGSVRRSWRRRRRTFCEECFAVYPNKCWTTQSPPWGHSWEVRLLLHSSQCGSIMTCITNLVLWHVEFLTASPACRLDDPWLIRHGNWVQLIQVHFPEIETPTLIVHWWSSNLYFSVCWSCMEYLYYHRDHPSVHILCTLHVW